jgi:hypothetical protein
MFFASDAVIAVVQLMDERPDEWTCIMGDWRHDKSGIYINEYRVYGAVATPAFGFFESFYVRAAIGRLVAAKIQKLIPEE